MAEYAVETMRSLGLVGNGQNSTLGDMQPERIQRMIEILARSSLHRTSRSSKA